jgi:type IV secretory pathway VirJ component
MCAPAVAQLTEESLSFGRFGDVWLYHQAPQPAHVVLFVSGDGGWNQGVVDMARDLASLDALVVGIDITHYLRELEAATEKCSYPASDFEALSQLVQKKLDYPAYVAPVLVGYSSGATLVYAILVQAPGTTFRGAISLGFCPDLPLTKPMCPGSGLTWGPGPKGKGYSFLPAGHLETPWVALQGTIDQVCDPATTEAFVRQTKNAELMMLPKVGHGYSVPKNWLPQFRAAFLKVVSAPSVDPTRMPRAGRDAGAAPEKPSPPGAAAPGTPAPGRPAPGTPAPAAPGGDPGDPTDLPLIEVAATGTPRGELVVHLTGDGGWGVTDKSLAEELSAAGVPVVGWNSLQYYWKKRTPDEAAGDLERILRHYLTVWGKERAILVGYSFGADVLPVIFNRLPADLQGRVSAVVLLGPSPEASFEFHITEWLGGKSGKDTYPVVPEIQRMARVKVICCYGQDDKEAICPSLDPSRVAILALDGGHRIGGRVDGLAQEILKALP